MFVHLQTSHDCFFYRTTYQLINNKHVITQMWHCNISMAERSDRFYNVLVFHTTYLLDRLFVKCMHIFVVSKDHPCTIIGVTKKVSYLFNPNAFAGCIYIHITTQGIIFILFEIILEGACPSMPMK